MPKLTLCLPPARWGPGTLDPHCSGNIAWFRWISFNFHQNLTIYTDVTVIQPLKCQNQPFVSHLLAENPGHLIPSVVAILPDFDGFLQITSKLDYLYRFSRNPTPTMPVLTLCLPPARWGPKAPDSECNGNIASFRRISSNLTKTRISIQI